MIDYLELQLNSNTETFLNRFGEKFTMVIGNIASHLIHSTVGCKIFSSFPYADSYTYRPPRKRVFVTHRRSYRDHSHYLQTLAITQEINFANLPWMDKKETESLNFNEFITRNQFTPVLPESFRWENYSLLGEGHYIQIYAHTNWKMLLPFVGEGESLELHHIVNNDNEDNSPNSPASPVSIESTHRDF